AGIWRVVTVVHEHRASLEEIAMALQQYVRQRLEQWMARAYELGQRLAGDSNQLFLKGYSFVADQDCVAWSDVAVTLPKHCGNVSDFVAARLAFTNSSTEFLERGKEIRFDEMWL